MTTADPPPPSRLSRLYGAVCRVEAGLAVALLILMVVLIFSGGVARMMRHPLNWTTDFATCFFAWAAFLAADVAWRSEALMSVDLVTARVGETVRRWLTYINYLLISAFLVYLIWSGTKLAILSAARSFQGVPWISYSWVTMSLPVGAALLLLTTGIRVHRALRRDGIVGSGETGPGRP